MAAVISMECLRWRPRGVLARARPVARQIWRVYVHDREGRIGCGEAAPIPGFATAPAVVAAQRAAAIAYLREVDDVATDAAMIGTWAAALPLVPEWRAALSTAAWDLAAQRRGVAPALLLNEAAAQRVAVAMLVHDARDALLAVQAGARAVKLKLGRDDWWRDIARTMRVRAAVGAGVELRVDANGSWSPRVARAAMMALARADVAWVEEPVSPGSWRLLRSLADYAPIGLDESLKTIADVEAAQALGTGTVAVIKPALVGGPYAAWELAQAAHAAGLRVVFTHAADAAVGRALALHVAAAWGRDTHGIYWAEAPDAGALPTPQAGWMSIAAEPLAGARGRQ